MSRWFQCTVCGKLFDPSDKSAFVHPNLWGGVDKLCKDCKKREDKAREEKNKVKPGNR